MSTAGDDAVGVPPAAGRRSDEVGYHRLREAAHLTDHPAVSPEARRIAVPPRPEPDHRSGCASRYSTS